MYSNAQHKVLHGTQMESIFNKENAEQIGRGFSPSVLKALSQTLLLAVSCEQHSYDGVNICL